MWVDAAADLGRTVTFCAKHDLGGMEGLIGVPGTVGGALRMNAGAYGTQIGSYVREVQVYRAADRPDGNPRGAEISFEYRHTSFAPDDIMLAVKLELPSKPYREILQGIRICNEKRRASQPLNQKSAGCIFKNPPGGSAGRMIDELGLKGYSVGDARVSDRHANFFVNAGHASCRGHARADRRGARTRARTLRRGAGRGSHRVEGIMSAEPDYLPADALAEEEPQYLRRQKPVEIRKRKFSRKAWPMYRRVLAGGIAALAVGWMLYEAAHYFLYSPSVMLTSAEQIEDRGQPLRSTRRDRRKIFGGYGPQRGARSAGGAPQGALEAIPWVEQARRAARAAQPDPRRNHGTHSRGVPAHRERTCAGGAHGVILERPAEGEFRFPVVSGIAESMPREEREKRMKLTCEFMKEIEARGPARTTTSARWISPTPPTCARR